MSIALNEKSKLSIERVTGLTYDEIVSMDSQEIRSKIEKRIGKKLRFKTIKDKRLSGRGSVYLFLNRFLNFDVKKLDRYIDSLPSK